MKKALFAVLVGVVMMFSVGCDSVEKADIVTDTESNRLVKTHEYFNGYIYVDVETGVEYVCIGGRNGCGVAVCVNDDGTPKIWDGYDEWRSKNG